MQKLLWCKQDLVCGSPMAEPTAALSYWKDLVLHSHFKVSCCFETLVLSDRWVNDLCAWTYLWCNITVRNISWLFVSLMCLTWSGYLPINSLQKSSQLMSFLSLELIWIDWNVLLGIWHHPVPIQSATTNVSAGVTGIYLLRHLSSVIHKFNTLLWCFIHQLNTQHGHIKLHFFKLTDTCRQNVLCSPHVWSVTAFFHSGGVSSLSVSWWRTWRSVTDWLEAAANMSPEYRAAEREKSAGTNPRPAAASAAARRLRPEPLSTEAKFQTQECQVDSCDLRDKVSLKMS